MKFLKYALIVLFSAGLMSCGGGGGENPGPEEKPDTESPKITISSPAVNSTISAREDLQVTATITDNKALSKYLVKIDPVSSGSMVKGNPEFKFNSDVDKDASGNSLPAIGENKTDFSLSFKVDIEQAAAQAYRLTIEATDAAGNDKTVVTRNFTVTRP